MSEMTIGVQAVVALFGLGVTSLFYMLGGRSGKWRRRYVGAFVLALTVNGLSAWRGIWTPYMLIVFPCLIAGFSMGYGGDNFGKKLFRRSLYALGVISAGLVFCFTLGANAWWILIPHAGVGAFSIFLGVKNPLKDAAAEEVFVCALLNLGLLMYPFSAGVV